MVVEDGGRGCDRGCVWIWDCGGGWLCGNWWCRCCCGVSCEWDWIDGDDDVDDADDVLNFEVLISFWLFWKWTFSSVGDDLRLRWVVFASLKMQGIFFWVHKEHGWLPEHFTYYDWMLADVQTFNTTYLFALAWLASMLGSFGPKPKFFIFLPAIRRRMYNELECRHNSTVISCPHEGTGLLIFLDYKMRFRSSCGE